jgi:membrane protease YdiL (CAAX protease family)
MWCLYGLVFMNFDLKDKNKRILYLKHNGDLAIMGALILIAGGILAGISVALFKAIGINIERFYSHYIIIIGLVSAPVLTTFILKNFNILTNKIASIIAGIFSPLVLITLIIWLIAIAISGKDPYNDRDFLLTFNIMLIVVMAIIVFSASETSINIRNKFNEIVLFILSSVTLLVNMIALSAIFYRLNEFGSTPNRLAILGSNILIFINLILITIDLFKISFKNPEINKIELTISKYLPVYVIWTLIVVFLFPLIFGMK